MKDKYPETVAEVLDDNIKYKTGTHRAIKKFKRSKPWRGEMQEKLLSLNKDLSEIYEIEPPQVVFVKKFAYGSCYFRIGNLIVMEQERDGRYSALVFLHEFGHALGKGEVRTCKWSINLFKKHFPKSYSRLIPIKHMLYIRKDKPIGDGSRLEPGRA